MKTVTIPLFCLCERYYLWALHIKNPTVIFCMVTSMKINEIKKDSVLYEQALALRYGLFFKEHNLSPDILDDGKENDSTHIAIYIEDQLIAYGRLFQVEQEEFQISQMVVSPKYQSQGYGTTLLIEIVKNAKDKGAKKITLNARITAINLYKKQGFKVIGGVYKSNITGISHIKMAYC